MRIFLYTDKEAARAEQALPVQTDFEDLDIWLDYLRKNAQRLRFDSNIIAVSANEVMLVVERELEKWEQEHRYLLISVLYGEKIYWATLREDFPIDKVRKKR